MEAEMHDKGNEVHDEVQNGLTQVNHGAIGKNRTVFSVRDLEHALFVRFPREHAEDWDNPGLVCGDAAETVHAVAVALDATIDAVRRAAAIGANVLVTHHPVFIDPPRDFCAPRADAQAAGSVIFEAARLQVSLIAMHTNLDVAAEANGLLSRMLHLSPYSVLEPRWEMGRGYGCLSKPKGETLTLGQLAARCLSVFGRVPRVWGDVNDTLDRIATVSGSGGSFIEGAVAQHADVLVTGEIGYHAALAAAERGLRIIELGHDVSELPMVTLLAGTVGEIGFPSDEVTIIAQNDNWSTPEARRV